MTRILLVAAALLLAVTGVLVWTLAEGDGDLQLDGPRDGSLVEDASEGARRVEEHPSDGTSSAADPASTSAKSGSAVSGRVADAEGRSLADVPVILTYGLSAGVGVTSVQAPSALRTTTGAEGRFRFEDVVIGFSLSVRDLIWDFLYRPLAGAVNAAANRLNRFQFLSIRQYLGLVFAALVLLLLMVALWR